MSNLIDDRLKLLLSACFDGRDNIRVEARHLARFFLESRLTKYDSRQHEQFLSELRESDVFLHEYGALDLFSGMFSDGQVRAFALKILDRFLLQKSDRQDLINVLKFTGSIFEVQKKLAEFLEENWRVDEIVADRALDIIWDVEVLSDIKGTLEDISGMACNEVLREHAEQLIEAVRIIQSRP
ncbi:MAG: hypothetical protein HUJ18_05055 [Marinobacter sp.]|nr:hypothetical protein [Marinobacter sp.]